MSHPEKKYNFKVPGIIKNNKGSTIQLSTKKLINKVVHGSITKKIKTSPNEPKNKRKNLVRRKNRLKVSFSNQPKTNNGYDESRTEVSRLNSPHGILTDKDRNMNIITRNKDENINIPHDHDSNNNESDTSSLFDGRHNYKVKTLDMLKDKKLKPIIRSSTPIDKYSRRKSLSSSVGSEKLKTRPRMSSNIISNKALMKRNSEINKVKEGRISKKATLLSSPQRREVSKSVKRLYGDLSEVYMKSILKIRQDHDSAKRRYPLRVRKLIRRYLNDL